MSQRWWQRRRPSICSRTGTTQTWRIWSTLAAKGSHWEGGDPRSFPTSQCLRRVERNPARSVVWCRPYRPKNEDDADFGERAYFVKQSVPHWPRKGTDSGRRSSCLGAAITRQMAHPLSLYVPGMYLSSVSMITVRQARVLASTAATVAKRPSGLT